MNKPVSASLGADTRGRHWLCLHCGRMGGLLTCPGASHPELEVMRVLARPDEIAVAVLSGHQTTHGNPAVLAYLLGEAAQE